MSEHATASDTVQVLLSSGWTDRWLARLSGDALRLYIALARFNESAARHSFDEVVAVLGLEDSKACDEQLKELEDLGLIELIRHEGHIHFHFPYRDKHGTHHADTVQPSIKEALEYQKTITERLLNLGDRDESPELRAEVFKEFPALETEWKVYEDTRDEDSPPWRLWLELSRFLIKDFEDRFGVLKDIHHEVFKESAAKVLSHKVAIVDGVSREVFNHRDAIFPEAHEDWIVSPIDGGFVDHATVVALSRRYGISPAQIFVNTLELFGQSGFVVAEVEKERLVDLVLPSTTGLPPEQERLLFLSDGEDEVDPAAVKEANDSYARYLMDRGVAVLREFVRRDRVSGLDRHLESIAQRVNEALELVPNRDEDDIIGVKDVLERYNDLVEAERTAVPAGEAGDRHEPND